MQQLLYPADGLMIKSAADAAVLAAAAKCDRVAM